MLGETEETPALNEASRGGDDTEENGNGTVGSLEQALKLAGLGKFNLLLLFVCGLGQASDAIETACISFLLPSACDLNLTSDEKGWLNATLFLGMLIGSYISGGISDVYGRKKTLYPVSPQVFHKPFLNVSLPWKNGQITREELEHLTNELRIPQITQLRNG